MSFTDEGPNTLDRQYFYRVMLYVGNSITPIDSSSVASSVRLTLTSTTGIINLDWRATVPWSNQIHQLPLTDKYQHRVYAVPVGATTLADTTLLTLVNVTAEGLEYSHTGLDPTQTYCYAVQTRGSYGNEDDRVEAVEPLKNFSQINCAMPVIIEPPCAPVIAAFVDVCKPEDYFAQYTCNTALFSTLVRWSKA
jgi:hypothetical protein